MMGFNARLFAAKSTNYSKNAEQKLHFKAINNDTGIRLFRDAGKG